MTHSKWILKIIFQYTMFILHTQCETFNIVIPVKTGFSCLNKTAGFYADTNANCKIYHTCDEYGNKFTYYCPKETAFRQDALICDHAHLVQCQGSISSNTTKYTEQKGNNSCCIEDSADRDQSFAHSLHITQPLRTNNKMGYGFSFSARQPDKNFTKMVTGKSNITNIFYSLNYTSPTTNIPIEHSVNTEIQYTSAINQHYKNGLRRNDNFSIQNDNFHDKAKLNEKPKMDQHNVLNQKVSDGLYNFLKQPSNTFSGNNQTQENNVKNYQPTKSPNNLLKLSSMNHRNYPYLETLKSIQKNTKIPSTTVSATVGNIALTTTELPVYALTLSLKPLIPSELEYDPYYPRFSTTTEPYYTPTHNIKELSHVKDSTQTIWSTTHFELPSVLPDLNVLEDIVDRRKLLYIPRVKFN
ncbi:unnamed protein product [Xylocopa violacea]|uniref:Chitin-binding type-2 domain-containing protein n=1 Tax=Xylocopa violacea TaxID=135666 RepID=A0ABP1PCF0_XYLVO